MKTLLLTAFVLCGVATFAQPCLEDSSHIYSPGPQGLYLTGKTYYTYNTNGLRTHELQKARGIPTAVFENLQQTSFTYNSAGKRTESVLQVPDAGIWKNSMRITNVYPPVYGDSITTSQTVQVWNSGTGTWDNSSSVAYTFNGPLTQNTPTEYTQYQWIGWWLPTDRYVYTYNANQQRNSYTRQYWDSSTSVWVNQTRYTYHFDANQDIDTITAHVWDETNNVWKNSSFSVNVNSAVVGQPVSYTSWSWDNANSVYFVSDRFTYFWNAFGKQDSMYQEVHNGTSWDYVSRTLMTYDTDGNQTSYKVIGWNGTGWQNSLIYTYTYNAYSYQTSRFYQEWDVAAGAWKDVSKDDHFYTCTGSAGLPEQVSQALGLYPNPAGDYIFLQTETVQKVTLYSLTGTVLGEYSVGKNQGIDVSFLPAGVYVLATKKGASKFLKQ